MPPTKRRRSTSPLPQGSSKKAATPSRPSTDSAGNKSPSNREWRQWKKQQSHDYNTHQFLDASATVHAGLFGARRLPEIKGLWRQMVQGELSTLNSDRAVNNGASGNGKVRQAGESGGGKISSRHLRRRTNSYRRRRRQRFPPKKGKGNLGSDRNGTKDGTKCSNNLGGNSANDFAAEKSELVKEGSDGKNQHKKKPCRRARRKPVLLKISHSSWWQSQTSTDIIQLQPSQQTNEQKSTHKWIPTHLWHAKRFHVSPPIFSWSIPLVHCNRGSRASLRLASSEVSPKCTIQDATWEVNGCSIVLELKGDSASSSSPSTQQSMQTIISIIGRICGDEAPFLNDESVLTGERAGEGLIHEIDASPLQPIGPASFFFHCQKNDDGTENARVSMLIHPAIHQRVASILATLCQSNIDTSNKVSISTMPLALLRIRGRASISTLRHVLGIIEDTGLVDGNESHGTLIEGGELPENLKAIPNAITGQSSILLKSHQPNQNFHHLPHNLSSSGWDILCHPSIGSILFQALVNKGGACPIGLLEYARACLEAYPPLPIFPRDFPDTDEGRAYWEGDTSLPESNRKGGGNQKQQLTPWKDWAVIRACVEGSWGRVNTPFKRTIRHWKQCDQHIRKTGEENQSKQSGLSPSETLALSTKTQLLGREAALVHWTYLISPEEESTIVVRGSFGIPFVQLLHGCARLVQPCPDAADNKRHRRPRRKVRPPDSPIHASPLSEKASDAHSNLCQQLRASLALPALLRCELYCEGKGTLNVGDLIFPLNVQDSDDDSEGSTMDDRSGGANNKLGASPLGVVVAGGFSPSRGKCHGAGFISAAKFIDAVDGTVHGVGMTIPQSNGQKNMALKVMVARDAHDDCGRYALMSLLL